jgi:nucleotide-binding universal stress UspA family protein
MDHRDPGGRRVTPEKRATTALLSIPGRHAHRQREPSLIRLQASVMVERQGKDSATLRGATMTLANILVHLDSKPRTAARMALSLRIAERVGARLTGLFAEKGDPQAGTVESARAAFAAAAAPLKDRAQFIALNRGGDHEIIHRLTAIARTFDLVVLGQTEDGVPVPAKLPDEVITESGRPVLVVPYVGTYDDVGRRPLFAWHNARGAARAVSDALPLLTGGCDALVIEVVGKSYPRYEFSDLLIANLAEHKVKARYEHSVVDEISVTDALLSAISDHSADLMAIGAFDSGVHALFGHGAGTRAVLAHMTAPVLFSH